VLGGVIILTGLPVPRLAMANSGIESCGDAYTPIYSVQGSGPSSPVTGAAVAIEGVVVGDFQGLDQKNGFFVQDPTGDGNPLTSDGIFVFAPSAPDVNIGDGVRVRGTVQEYSGLTEIAGVVQVWICSGGNAVTPTSLTLPMTALDDFERVEGMLVTFPQALTIAEYFNFDRYNEIVLASDIQYQPTAVAEPGAAALAVAAENALGRITLDDGSVVQNPDPAIHPNGAVFDLTNRFRGGDEVEDVTGAMDYAFGLYRVQPTMAANYTARNPRPAAPDEVGGSLRVASVSLFNYFLTIDSGLPICGPDLDQDCRGADTPEEWSRQRAKILDALVGLDSDIVGLVELENTTGVDPAADLVSGLNDIVGAGTYARIDTGVIGTDAIRVGLIYKPAVVSPVGSFAVLDSTVDASFLDEYNRPVLAQTFEATTGGERVTVAVSHLKSKGSSCDAIGDPDTGDGQGNCNLTREKAALALADWLATDPTGSGSAAALIIGDLNAYAKEDPVAALQTEGYTDLIALYGGTASYSYLFDGQRGYLDHALASAGLLDAVTGATIWHINADEPDILDYDMTFKKDAQDALYEPNGFRSSDHDPVLVGLDLCEGVAPVIDVSVTPDLLWPPNHKYVNVTATVTVSDNIDPDPSWTLVSVTSNEPDNGDDDGNTVNDIVIVDEDSFRLRAERSGAGTGRVYTITYRVTDSCGNSAIGSAAVRVPLSK